MITEEALAATKTKTAVIHKIVAAGRDAPVN
jgi:hypothetical protein